MTIKVDQILSKLERIDGMVAQIRNILSNPDGVRITAAWRDNLSYVEYWDENMPPRILFLMEEKVEEEIMHQYLFDAVSC